MLPKGLFGHAVLPLPDLDGDGHRDVIVGGMLDAGAPSDVSNEVFLFPAATGRVLRQWSDADKLRAFGLVVAGLGDVDSDGSDDIAIGAPRHRIGDREFVGRAEVRSGKTGAVLAEWFGEEANSWFGWHIRRAPDPDGKGRHALLIGSLMHAVGGQPRVGVIDLYVLRREK